MKLIYTVSLIIMTSLPLNAAPLPDMEAAAEADRQAIETVASNYIVSQHISSKELMAGALHPALAKRTYWSKGQQQEFIMETSRETMLKVAESYNKSGDKFPENPRVEITILDLDQRAASVKLSADDWIDYMHLIKTAQGQWKILNVLWQYHDIGRHK
ncbi:nuclear transport factor 2 family protein [Thalassomonas sp. RHCl1]|uniref:nuclear transport factor 2 family protein n=1 Tax=Thalassomonas sp. RHCl1 TaxID=2995320 RepID=UPI00248D023F|nr:nuclear transport factor 2 family protein [Thalassomonas sp. RHCl1]